MHKQKQASLWTEKNQKQIQHRCDVRLSDYGPRWPRRHATYSKPSHSLFVFDIEPLVKTFADSVGGISGREKTSQGLNLNSNYLKWRSKLIETMLEIMKRSRSITGLTFAKFRKPITKMK